MGILNKPHTFSPNTTILSSQVNADFDTLYNGINGNIDQNNLADDAVVTSKIADDAVTTDKIDDGAVTLDKLNADLAAGWSPLGVAPATVTALGNRSYSAVFSGTDLTDTLYPGMRLKLTRTVAAPTQCTDLESGSSQYYSRASASVSAIAFTDDFAVSAWVKLESYAAGTIISRYNGTSGWIFHVTATGQVYLGGYNGSSANLSQVNSYQSLPLNKWVHVAAQLDMSAFTTHNLTPNTSYIMFDGVDVPATVSRTGTNPTNLVQAGNLEVGSFNAGNFFDGKIAQVALYSAKVTQANIRATMSQGLSGSETSILVAYPFNGVVTDLTSNGYTLTANGSAVATATDSPFSDRLNVPSSITSGTVDYGIVTKVSYSTDTTVTIQVPEGCAIPTSGGVSAVSYSGIAVPYGFPAQRSKWQISVLVLNTVSTSGTVAGTVYNPGGLNLTVPVGEWGLTFELNGIVTPSASAIDCTMGMSTSSSAFISGTTLAFRHLPLQTTTSSATLLGLTRTENISVSTQTPYYLLITQAGAFSSLAFRGVISTTAPEATEVTAELALL